MKRLVLVAMMAVAFIAIAASLAEAKVSHFVLAGTPYASYVKPNGERVTFEVTWEYHTLKTGEMPVAVKQVSAPKKAVQDVSEIKKAATPKVAVAEKVSPKFEKKAAEVRAAVIDTVEKQVSVPKAAQVSSESFKIEKNAAKVSAADHAKAMQVQVPIIPAPKVFDSEKEQADLEYQQMVDQVWGKKKASKEKYEVRRQYEIMPGQIKPPMWMERAGSKYTGIDPSTGQNISMDAPIGVMIYYTPDGKHAKAIIGTR